MNRVIVENITQLSSVKLYDFQHVADSDYLQFKLDLKNPFFHVVTISRMNSDEFTDFKENLNLMLNQQKQNISLNPLGEFWIVEFCKVEDGIEVKGDISDRLFPQNNLRFRFIVCWDCLKELGNQIDSLFV